METLPTTFEPKHEKAAELVAYLTDGVIYKDANKIHVIDRKDLDRIISEKYEKKDFIGMNEIIEAAKKTTEITTEELAERVSKSIRVPTYTYLKLIKYACENNISLADIVREAIIPEIREELDKIGKLENIPKDRFMRIYRVSEEWSATEKKRKGKEKYEPKFEWISILDNLFNRNIFEQLIKKKIYDDAKKHGIPKKLIDRYINLFVDITDLNDEEISAYISTNKKDNKLKIKISWRVAYGIENDAIILEEEIKSDFGHDAWDKFKSMFAYVDIAGGYYEILIDHEFSGTLTVRDKKIFIDGIEVNEKNKNALDRLIYEKISGEKYSDMERFIKEFDLEKAKKFSEKLAMHQVYQGVSAWYRDILLSICKSQVVTFTMPPILLSVLDIAGKGDKIPELIDNYLNSR